MVISNLDSMSIMILFFSLFSPHLSLTFCIGMITPKPLMRRDQMEGSPNNSESFEHIARTARDHAVSLSEPRMMWGSDPYPHTEPQQATTPKATEESEDVR